MWSFLLSLAFLLGPAWAGDGVEGVDDADLAVEEALESGVGSRSLPERPLRDREVPGVIRDFQSSFGGPVLVAAVGPEANDFLEIALRTLDGDIPLEIGRVPFMGVVESEMQRALDRSAITCGLRVARDIPGSWRITAHGDCQPLDEDLEVLLLDDALAEDLLLEDEAEDELAIDLDSITLGSALDRYRVQRLVRTHLGQASAALYDTTWIIQDGRGRPISTVEFARLTGDISMRTRLVGERRQMRARRSVQVVVGGALLGTAALVFLDAGADYPSWSDYKHRRWDFATTEEYESAQDEARLEYEQALDAVPRDLEKNRENRRWASAFLAVSGGMVVGTAHLVPRGLEDRQQVPALYYSAARAQALIDVHNTNLRRELGLEISAAEQEAAASALAQTTVAPPEIRLSLSPSSLQLQVRF